MISKANKGITEKRFKLCNFPNEKDRSKGIGSIF